MAVLSGRDAEIALESSNPIDFVEWTLTYGSNIETFAARSGAGAQETGQGIDNGTGSLTFMMNSTSPFTSLISSGTLTTLTLKNDTGGTEATGQARLGQYTLSANRDGTLQRITVPFTCHGSWTLPS